MLNHLSHLRERRANGEAGLSLIEVLLATMVLAIITAPIALTFMSSMTVADATQEQYRQAANRDKLSTWLGRDAASVDAAGVSTSLACETATQPASDHLVVSFTSTALTPTGAVTSTRASYWVTGTGEDMTLVRRYCENVDVADPNPAVGTDELVLVTRFGSETSTDPAVEVHGPIDNGTPRVNPCVEEYCTLVINGDAKFEVTAQRRVFGAGVPLEVNKLYSSSAVVAADPVNPTAAETAQQQRNQLAHLARGGEVTGEYVWPGRVSLAPGIDPAGPMQVNFRVQARGSNEDGAPALDGTERYFDGTTWSPTDAWVPGTFLNGQWQLDLPLTDIQHGGEFRVWTQLVPSSGEVKQYGGAVDTPLGGFPLWFDWKVTNSVFVDPTNGDDARDGLKPSTSVRTLARGLVVARSSTRPEIHVLSATTHAAPTGGLALVAADANTSIIGGYNAGWKRGAVDAAAGAGAKTTIAGPSSGNDRGAGLIFTGSTGTVRLRQVAVQSGTVAAATGYNATTLQGNAGASAYGIQVRGSMGLKLEASTVTASPGAAGAAGGRGADGGNGCRGRQTEAASTSSNQIWDTPYTSAHHPSLGPNAAPCTTSGERAAGYGGAGGAGGVFGGGSGGQGGGYGGRYGTSDNRADPGGGGGKSCTSAGGGGAGRGGSTGTIYGENDLLFGSTGWGGGYEDGTVQAPTFGATGYQGLPGMRGIRGQDGRGGGGGGGGGGNSCVNNTGRQGATGGQGGEGGRGGGGGGAGGASIGVYVTNASATLTLDRSTVTAGAGGVGGAGGRGGDGGNGGPGGRSYSSNSGGDSGAGGGGAGGAGGGGGGGGQGGPSIAVYVPAGGTDPSGAGGNALTAAERNALLTSGSAGAGGWGGGRSQATGSLAVAFANRAQGRDGGAGGQSSNSCGLNLFGWCVIGWNSAGGYDGQRGNAAFNVSPTAGNPNANSEADIGRNGASCRFWKGTACA